jgi:hypothetical protein
MTAKEFNEATRSARLSSTIHLLLIMVALNGDLPHIVEARPKRVDDQAQNEEHEDERYDCFHIGFVQGGARHRPAARSRRTPLVEHRIFTVIRISENFA